MSFQAFACRGNVTGNKFVLRARTARSLSIYQRTPADSAFGSCSNGAVRLELA